MRKTTFILTITFLLSLTSIAQTKYHSGHISLKVKILVHKLKKYKTVTGPRIGKGAAKSDQYALFEKLELKASEDELFELTNHKSPIVRAFSFTGLVNKNSVKTLDVISKNQNDTVTIKQQFGCIGADNNVIGYMLMFIKPYLEKSHATLTVSQKDLIDKLSSDQRNWRDRMRQNPLADDDDE